MTARHARLPYAAVAGCLILSWSIVVLTMTPAVADGRVPVDPARTVIDTFGVVAVMISDRPSATIGADRTRDHLRPLEGTPEGTSAHTTPLRAAVRLVPVWRPFDDVASLTGTLNRRGPPAALVG